MVSVEKEATKTLLQESNKGSKMAVSNIDMVIDSVECDHLREELKSYKQEHEDLGKQMHELLTKRNIEDREPGIWAKAMANMMTELKLHNGPADKQVAKLMMDGCNMGIQSLAAYRNSCEEADEEALTLTKQMIDCEHRFMERMEKYL